jgi:hypothetical protein|tara:strand:+ start:3467 stop:3742 length:276 start_codon:yes stop_codon:yes gene_type:complete
MITEDCSWTKFQLEIISQLKEHECEVTFTKVNGEERVMKCTLQESFLPQTDKATATNKENSNVVSVWDIEKNAWRSFRMDSLTSFEVSYKE